LPALHLDIFEHPVQNRFFQQAAKDEDSVQMPPFVPLFSALGVSGRDKLSQKWSSRSEPLQR
jgi:hypothetical protein